MTTMPMIDALIVTGFEPHAFRRGESNRLSRLVGTMRKRGMRVALLDCALMQWSAAETIELVHLAAPSIVVLDEGLASPAQLAEVVMRVRASHPAVPIAVLARHAAPAPRLPLANPSVELLPAGADDRSIIALVDAVRAQPVGPSCSPRNALPPSSTSPAGDELPCSYERELALEYGLLAGCLEVRAGSAPSAAPAAPEAWQPLAPLDIGDDIEATVRATGVRRLQLVGLGRATAPSQAIAWFRELSRELSRRDCDVHLGLVTTRDLLLPELLSCVRAASVHTLVLRPDCLGAPALPFRDTAIIDLAREHRLMLLLESELLAGSESLAQVREMLAFLRRYFTWFGGAYLLFGRGNGRELLLSLHSLAQPPPADAGDASLVRFRACVEHLYRRCLWPLYECFRTLLRYWTMMRRDARERSLRLTEVQVPALIDRLRTPMLDLVEWLAMAPDGRHGGSPAPSVAAADAVVLSVRQQLFHFARFALKLGMKRGLRYATSDSPSGAVLVGVGGRAVIAPRHELTTAMVRLYNHLPRTTVLARLARFGSAPELASLYAALLDCELADSAAALAAMPEIELPGEILR